MLLKFIGSSAAAHVGIDYGIKGPTFGTVSACATATHAIGLMMRFIREGVCDVGVAGASELTINYGCMKAWQAIRVLSPEGCFPFAKKRDGFVMGEGAAILVLEELEHARRRGAQILAELAGFGSTADAYHITAPKEDGAGPTRAMRLALADGGVDPTTVDYVNAHGTSTEYNDIVETKALKALFGDHARKLAISSTKSMIGHLLGAAGAIGAVVSTLSVARGVVHPTRTSTIPTRSAISTTCRARRAR